MKTVLWVVLGVYVAILALVLYVCVVADPEKSALARFCIETLPRKCSRCFENAWTNPRIRKGLEYVSDRVQLILYFVLVLGCWSLIFVYVYPWVDRSETVGNHHKIIGYLLFVACLASWWLASSASPGIITKETLHRYQHFPYDHVIFTPVPCPTRGLIRPARSRFDRMRYNENIPRYDHWCGWLYNAIGEENHRHFFLFLLIHVVMCIYGSVMLGYLFYGEIQSRRLFDTVYTNRKTGKRIKASWWRVSKFLVNRHMAASALWVIITLLGVGITCFFLYHVYLTSRGMTTNETFKWEDVNKRYRRQLRLYQQQAARRPKNEKEEGDSAPMIDAAESVASYRHPWWRSNFEERQQEERQQPRNALGAPQNQTEFDEGGTETNATRLLVSSTGESVARETIRYPGPKPKNIYDRGFVENWKEVLFPISLRKENRAHGEEGWRCKAKDR